MAAATMIVLLTLKDGVDPDEYERWARETDGPTVTGFPSVDDWRLYRAERLIGSDAQPGFAYVEVVEVNDVDQLGRDVAGPQAQEMTRQLARFAHPPTFVLTDRVV